MSLLQSLLTGSWRLEREAVRDQIAYARATRPIRERMVREHELRAQYFAGANPGINRQHANPLSSPEDYRQAAERIVLIRAARQLEEDGGFFDGLLDDFETYVVGPQLIYMPNTGNAEADKVIREYLDWQFDQADYSERRSLTKMAKLGIREMKRDGECGFVPVDVGDAIKLHMVAGDCIGNPMLPSRNLENNYGGIIVEPDSGAPVRFEIFRRDPKKGSYTLHREIPAGHFWHYCDPFRIQQYHGVSAFKNAIRDGFDIDQILEFTKLNIKWRSSQLPTVHTADGRPKNAVQRSSYLDDQDSGSGATTIGKNPTALSTTVGGVEVNYMDLESRVMEYPNDFPNAQLKISIEEFRRQCCKGVKVPYEFAYAADNGGVVQRFWVNKAENTFANDKVLLRGTALDPYKNRVIDKGIETGELDLRRFGDLDVNLARFRGTWQMGREISVDYGRENQTDMELCDAGLMSEQDKAASMGRNLDDINAEKKAQARKILIAAKALAEEFKITIQDAIPMLAKKWPNPPSNQQSAPAVAETEA